MKRSARVALLIETSTSYGRGIIRGIDRYARDHGDWLIHWGPYGRYQDVRLPAGWAGDGAIARIKSQRLADEIISSGIPAVNVSWYTYGMGKIPWCSADEHQSGRAAAKHFLDRGFRRFAYVGSLRRPNYVDRFGEAFVETLRGFGYGCVRYKPRRPRKHGSWQASRDELGRWLTPMAKPVAVLTFDAERGRQVTEACRNAGVRVPDEVAVLGGEQDDLNADLSHPPLSVMDLAPERIGCEAAAMLDRMMAGKPAPTEPVLIPPGGVIARQSTDTLAIDDEEIVQAIRYIRAHAREPIQVGDVLRRVPVARRVLEQRFQAVLRRSPAAEIRRVRVEHARRLLEDTDLAMPEVAARSGFQSAEVLARAFRRETGMTPSTYRKQALRQRVSGGGS